MSSDLAVIIYYIDFCNHYLKHALTQKVVEVEKKEKATKKVIQNNINLMKTKLNQCISWVTDEIIKNQMTVTPTIIREMVSIQNEVKELLKDPTKVVQSNQGWVKFLANGVSSVSSGVGMVVGFFALPCIPGINPSINASSVFCVYNYDSGANHSCIVPILNHVLKMDLSLLLLSNTNSFLLTDPYKCQTIRDKRLFNDLQRFDWITQDVSDPNGRAILGMLKKLMYHSCHDTMVYKDVTLTTSGIINNDTTINQLYQKCLLSHVDQEDVYEAAPPYSSDQRKANQEFQLRFRYLLCYRIMYMVSLIVADEYTYQYIKSRRTSLTNQQQTIKEELGKVTVENVRKFRHKYGYKIDYTFGLPKHVKQPLRLETVTQYFDRKLGI